MTKQNLFLAGALALALGFGAAASAATPAGAHAQASAEAIPYENLHGYLGDRITVHTKFKTTRTGTLAKFSRAELTLSIDTPAGPTELTIPKDTIVEIVPAAPASH